jgi:hypothetical protein
MSEGKKTDVKCVNCKHSYSYFKQITNEKGLPDFITIPRCRLDHEILPDGTPLCLDCFEPRR